LLSLDVQRSTAGRSAAIISFVNLNFASPCIIIHFK
jgi:hypothetical protein